MGLRDGDMEDEAPANPLGFTLGVRTPDGCRELEPGGLRAPEANRGFQELREAVLVGPPHVDCRLLIDDEEILPVDAAGNVASSSPGPGGPATASRPAWIWKPGFYAGTVRAELVDDTSRALGTWWLDVSPDPAKAGGGTFERMVEQIAEFDESLLVGDEPARRQLGAVGAEANPHVLFERLRRRETDLHRAVAAVQREPASVLRPRRQFVAFHQARRADLRTLRVAMRRPEACAVLRRQRGAQPAFAGTTAAQPRFDTPEVERRLDAPVNRCALYLLRALQRRCRDLAEKLEEMEKVATSETRTPLQSRVVRRREILGRIERRLRFAERRSPFRDARRSELTAAGLTAVAAHPLYSRFWRVGWEALRRGVFLHDPRDPLPITPTWEVYERWCFVEVARLLERCLPGVAWSAHREVHLGRGWAAEKTGWRLTFGCRRLRRTRTESCGPISGQFPGNACQIWFSAGGERAVAVLWFSTRSTGRVAARYSTAWPSRLTCIGMPCAGVRPARKPRSCWFQMRAQFPGWRRRPTSPATASASSRCARVRNRPVGSVASSWVSELQRRS